MSQVGVAIGQAGSATLKRLPAGTNIAYTHGANTYNLTLFNSIDKGLDADTAQTTGNAGEWLAERKRNQRIDVHIEAKPAGNKTTDAVKIVKDPPVKLDTLTITASEDTQLNGTVWYVNSKVDVRYSPDNDAILSFDAILRLDDSGAPLAIAALPET